MKIAAGNRQTLVMLQGLATPRWRQLDSRQEKREWKHLKIPPHVTASVFNESGQIITPKGGFHLRKSPCWNPPWFRVRNYSNLPRWSWMWALQPPAFEFRFGTSFTDGSQKFGKSLILMFHLTRLELLEGLSTFITEKNEGVGSCLLIWQLFLSFQSYVKVLMLASADASSTCSPGQHMCRVS